MKLENIINATTEAFDATLATCAKIPVVGWHIAGNKYTGRYQQEIKELNGIADNRYTWFGIVGNLIINAAKFTGAYYLSNKDAHHSSIVLEYFHNASIGGLLFWGTIGTSEAIGRSIYCIKTNRPIGQLSTEFGIKGCKSLWRVAKNYQLSLKKISNEERFVSPELGEPENLTISCESISENPKVKDAA